MYAGRKTGVGGDALKERKELSSLALVERCENFRFQCVGLGLHRLEYLADIVGEVDRVRAPVGRMRLPGHQCAFLELVDQSHHRVAVDPQQIREFLLAAAIRNGQLGEDCEVGRVEIQSRQLLGELVRHVKTDLRQQECRA